MTSRFGRTIQLGSDADRKTASAWQPKREDCVAIPNKIGDPFADQKPVFLIIP